MSKSIKMLCILMILCSFCGVGAALTNLQPNGDFSLYPDSPVKTGTSWIGNESTKWCIFYTSNPMHTAQLIEGDMYVITGSDGSINDISIAGVPSSDPILSTWNTYGTIVNGSTTYTAFVFADINKTNAVYFNVRQAKADGTNKAALISPRNTVTGKQVLQYQFTTDADTRFLRVGIVLRNANTKAIYYSAGAYQGVTNQLNKPTTITYISPITSILPDMQPTFTGVFSDIDKDVGIYNQVNVTINGVTHVYDNTGYSFNNLFLPAGVSYYNVTVIDLFTSDTVSDTYSVFVPDIRYVDVVNDDETGVSIVLNDTFIIFVVYIGVMVFLQDKYQSGNTLMLFGIIESLVLILLMLDIENIESYGSRMQYLTYVFSNAYLMFLTFIGLRKDIL